MFMKKLLIVLVVLVASNIMVAQNNKEFKKRPAISVGVMFNDFPTASKIKNDGLGRAYSGKAWRNTRNMNPGIMAGFHNGINNHLDYSVRLSGSFLNYPNSLISGFGIFGQDKLLLELDASAHLKLLSDKYWASPYLTLGIAGSRYKGYFGAVMPAGVGLQVNLYDEAFVFLNAEHRQAVTENTTNHVWYGLGVAGNIGKRKPLPIELPKPEVVKDTDGDGILDNVDKCVDVPGIAKYDGCPIPDTDKDGINDEEDKCVDVPGLAKYNGCPIPDTDKDGINDEEDKCVDVPGIAKYQGCPMPDKDNDGIADEDDKCPEVAGVAAFFGCPEIKEEVIQKIERAAKNIYFNTGKSTLLPKSFKSLNEVVAILKEDETLRIDVGGHTDNTGKADKNQTLSEARAAAVRAYLIKKGISEDRLTSAGYGQDQPVADNATVTGRAENRRVELKLRNY
jgi:OmpA-OmpF porin, OOP family